MLYLYMVVSMCDGNPYTDFFNALYDAERYRQNIVCGLGGSAQVYELNEDMQIYEFMYE